MLTRNICRKTAYAICLVLLSGCISPSPHSRRHIRDDVLNRTGHDLGPPKSICDLMMEEWVDLNDGLSEDEAIALGLWNNPSFQELLADLQIAQADVMQAAQATNPHLDTLFPLGPKQWEFALLVPLEVLWLRPIRVSAAELESHRVAERLAQDGLNVIRDVRVAYIDWQLAVQRAQLTEQGAQLRTEIARIAEARLAAGDVAELDVSPVRLDAIVGKGEAARAARDASLARERLRNLLGLQLYNFSLTPTPMPEREMVEFDIDLLVDEAISSRPDLRAVQLAVSAAQDRAALARRSVWQVSAIMPDINSFGRKGFEAGPGLKIYFPLFHQNQGEIAQAEADAERLRRQYINRRDAAALEVRQAHILFLQAKQDLEIWRHQVLPLASEAVTNSQKSLEENGVSLLLVLETTRQFLTAQQTEIEADAQLRRAIAELERSVGRRLVDVDANQQSHLEVLPLPQVELGEDAS